MSWNQDLHCIETRQWILLQSTLRVELISRYFEFDTIGLIKRQFAVAEQTVTSAEKHAIHLLLLAFEQMRCGRCDACMGTSHRRGIPFSHIELIWSSTVLLCIYLQWQ